MEKREGCLVQDWIEHVVVSFQVYRSKFLSEALPYQSNLLYFWKNTFWWSAKQQCNFSRSSSQQMQDILKRKKEYFISDGTQSVIHVILPTEIEEGFIVNATFLMFVPLSSV